MVKLVEDEGDEPDWTREQYEAGAAQATALAEKAAVGGLSFDAYLPPGLADWALAQIVAGRFCDPSELVFVLLGLMRDIERYAPELISTALSRSINAASQEPMRSSEEFEQHLKAKLQQAIPPAAEWVKPEPQAE